MSDLESAWKELEPLLSEEFMLEIKRYGPRPAYGKTDTTYEVNTETANFGYGPDLASAFRMLAADIKRELPDD